jgi:hypothetical protein
MTTNAPAMNQQPVQSKGSMLALFSLILGILSFCLWIFGAIPAIILGIIALAQISGSQGQLRGKGLAITGIVTGSLGLFFAWVFWIMAFTAIGIGTGVSVGFTQSRQLSQGRAIINNARQIDAAIDQWALENGVREGPVNCASVAFYLRSGPLQEKVAALGAGGGKISTVLPIFDIEIGNVGSTQITITPEAKQSLPAVYDWGMY